MCLKQKIHDAFAAELIDVLYSETSKTRRDAVIDKLKAFEPKVMAILAEEESKAEVQYVSHQTAQIPLCPQPVQTPAVPRKLKDNLGLVHIEECQMAGPRIYPAVFAALLGHRTYNEFYAVLKHGLPFCKKGVVNVQTKKTGGPEQLAKSHNQYPWMIFMVMSDKDMEAILRECGRLSPSSGPFNQELVIPIVLKDVVEYAKNPVGDPIWVTDPQYVQKLVDLVNK